MEADARRYIAAVGGKVIGSVRQPMGTMDFASALLQAQSSKAKVIGLANAGADTINALKGASEFGIVAGGQKLAAMLIFLSDVHSLGLQIAQGLQLTESFYWDLNDKTRAWSKRFGERIGRPHADDGPRRRLQRGHALPASGKGGRTRSTASPSPPRCTR